MISIIHHLISIDVRSRLFVDHIRQYACVKPVTLAYRNPGDCRQMEDMVKALLREDYAFLKRVVNKNEDYLLTDDYILLIWRSYQTNVLKEKRTPRKILKYLAE